MYIKAFLLYKADFYVDFSSFPVSLITPIHSSTPASWDHLPVKPPASNSFLRLRFGENPN